MSSKNPCAARICSMHGPFLSLGLCSPAVACRGQNSPSVSTPSCTEASPGWLAPHKKGSWPSGQKLCPRGIILPPPCAESSSQDPLSATSSNQTLSPNKHGCIQPRTPPPPDALSWPIFISQLTPFRPLSPLVGDLLQGMTVVSQCPTQTGSVPRLRPIEYIARP